MYVHMYIAKRFFVRTRIKAGFSKPFLSSLVRMQSSFSLEDILTNAILCSLKSIDLIQVYLADQFVSNNASV